MKSLRSAFDEFQEVGSAGRFLGLARPHLQDCVDQIRLRVSARAAVPEFDPRLFMGPSSATGSGAGSSLTGPAVVRLRRFTGPLFTIAVVSLSAGCDGDGPTEPQPLPHSPALEIATTTERFASDSEGHYQLGEFFYDGEGRLLRWEFSATGHIFGPPQPLSISQYVEYTYDGNRLSGARQYSTRLSPGDTVLFAHVDYEYDGAGFLARTTTETLDATGTTVVTQTITYEYQGGRLVETTAGDQVTRFFYDDAGNVHERRAYLESSTGGLEHVTSTVYEYGSGENPFYGLPRRSGVVLIDRPPLGPNLATSSRTIDPATGEVGSFSEHTYVLDAFERPIEHRHVVTNPGDPPISTVIESEYTYRTP